MKSENFQMKRKLNDKATIGFLFSMLVVPILNFLIFWVYVNYRSIMYAFELPSGEFTWINFEWVFNEFVSENSVMLEALENTLLFFAVNIFFCMPVAVILSYFLYKKIWGSSAFRVIFYLPSIISAVVLTTVYKEFIGPTGPISLIMTSQGMQAPEFLKSYTYAIWAVVLYSVITGFGNNLLLMSGAMARIPEEIVESAMLDGIHPMNEMIKIVIPLIWPTLSTLLVFAFAGLFSSSGPILLLTKGNYGTMTISYWIFDQVNSYQSYWNASAAGLIYTVIGVPIALGSKYLFGRIMSDVEY